MPRFPNPVRLEVDVDETMVQKPRQPLAGRVKGEGPGYRRDEEEIKRARAWNDRRELPSPVPVVVVWILALLFLSYRHA